MKQQYLFLSALLAASVQAFVPAVVTRTPLASTQQRHQRQRPLAAVADIGSEGEFDKAVKGAGDKLVIVDYSTTWCGPCKGVCCDVGCRQQ